MSKDKDKAKAKPTPIRQRIAQAKPSGFFQKLKSVFRQGSKRNLPPPQHLRGKRRRSAKKGSTAFMQVFQGA
jgi:hypothetical protein